MEIQNILGSLVNNFGECYGTPFSILQIMEKKVKLYPSDSFINEFHCNIAAFCHLLAKKEGRENVGFHRIRLNGFPRYMIIMIRAIEVIEDNYDKGIFRNKKFMKYEVEDNPWGIEFLEYRRGEGFFAIGNKLDLLRTPPISYTIKY